MATLDRRVSKDQGVKLEGRVSRDLLDPAAKEDRRVSRDLWDPEAKMERRVSRDLWDHREIATRKLQNWRTSLQRCLKNRDS